MRQPRHLGALVALVSVLSVCACTQALRAADVDKQVDNLFDLLRHHRDEAFFVRLDPRIQTPETRKQISTIANTLPGGNPLRRIAISTNTLSASSGDALTTTDEYDYPDGAVLWQVRLLRTDRDHDWFVEAAQAQVATAAQLASNDFTLAGRDAEHYYFLAMMVASATTCVAAAIKVILTRGLRRKALWALVALFGVGVIRMNWANGALDFQLAQIQFLGAGTFRSITRFAPWNMLVSIPIPALLILTGIWPRGGGKSSEDQPMTSRPP